MDLIGTILTRTGSLETSRNPMTDPLNFRVTNPNVRTSMGTELLSAILVEDLIYRRIVGLNSVPTQAGHVIIVDE